MTQGNASGETLRAATSADAQSIAEIYNYYITDTVVTFEEESVSAAEIALRIDEVTAASLPWLVAERDEQVVGYAYGGKFKTRSAYRFSSEVAVYLRQSHLGLGLGTRLFGELLSRLASAGVHAVIGGIALPNPASIALHEKFGLSKVAHFSEVGFKFGRWIDVGYWQRTL